MFPWAAPGEATSQLFLVVDLDPCAADDRTNEGALVSLHILSYTDPCYSL